MSKTPPTLARNLQEVVDHLQIRYGEVKIKVVGGKVKYFEIGERINADEIGEARGGLLRLREGKPGQ